MCMKKSIMPLLLITVLTSCSSQSYQTKCSMGKWDACYKLKARCDGGNADACAYYERVSDRVNAREAIFRNDPVAAEQIRIQEAAVDEQRRANRVRAWQASQPVKVQVKGNCTTTRNGNTAQTHCY